MILSMYRSVGILTVVLLASLMFLGEGGQAWARDAAFADPGMMQGAGAAANKAVGDAVVVEPKGDIDTGESVINMPRRTTIYFVNKTNAPVEVVGVATNDDLNVKTSVVSDDCSREGKIAPSNRCNVVVEATPINTGLWTSEVLMTHKGAGRIARAKLMGRAGSQSSTDKKDAGFTLSTKDVKPIDFGAVDVSDPKVVRTALMVNDSPEDITLVSIDVIAAENGLERLDQGCVVDMELRPGESCPVTLLWKPESKGLISTDLIIRHTGKLGFAVIPIRGVAKDAEKDKETSLAAKSGAAGAKGETSKSASKESEKGPTAAEILERSLADRIPQLTADSLPTNVTTGDSKQAAQNGEFRLIGTVGSRAILLKPDGVTSVVSLGEVIPLGDGKTAKLTNVAAKSAEIFIDGKKKELIIGAAQELTGKAASAKSSKDNSSDASRKKTTTSYGDSSGAR